MDVPWNDHNLKLLLSMETGINPNQESEIGTNSTYEGFSHLASQFPRPGYIQEHFYAMLQMDTPGHITMWLLGLVDVEDVVQVFRHGSGSATITRGRA